MNRMPSHKPFTSSNKTHGQRATASERGYDYAWIKLRQQVLKEETCCYLCGCAGRVDDHVDHVIPFDGVNDPKRLDRTNLRRCHRECHSRKTSLFDGGFGREKRYGLPDSGRAA